MYLPIFPQQIFLPLGGTILSAPNTLPGRNLYVLTYFLLLTWGISCDVTINKNIALKQANVIGGFQSDILKINWCVHILGVRANLTKIIDL
jgi:hypothetical protein